MEPKVSAIITTYNYGRFISDAIKCVLEQTRRPDEIIVVDDGSTDNTREIVAGFADQGVRYLYKENGGAGSARNAGIRASSGDLIAFLDADDRWVPNKIELQLEHLKRYPKAGLISGSERDVYVDNDHAEDVIERKPVGAANMYYELLVENTLGNPSLTLIRRACFDKVGLFDENMRLGQDWDMWIRIARRFPIGVVGEVLNQLTLHNNSLTAGKTDKRITSNNAIHQRYISQVRSPWKRFNLFRAARSMSFYYAAAGLADDPTKLWNARPLALAALLLDPFYNTKIKVGVVIRSLLGASNFARLRRLPANIVSHLATLRGTG